MSRTRTIRALNSSTAFETRSPAPEMEPGKIPRHEEEQKDAGGGHASPGECPRTRDLRGGTAWQAVPGQDTRRLPGHPAAAGCTLADPGVAEFKAPRRTIPAALGTRLISSNSLRCQEGAPWSRLVFSRSGRRALISSCLYLGDERAAGSPAPPRVVWRGHLCEDELNGRAAPASHFPGPDLVF